MKRVNTQKWVPDTQIVMRIYRHLILAETGNIHSVKKRSRATYEMLPCRLPKSNQTLHQILTMKQPI
jgi:hypothetical protein